MRYFLDANAVIALLNNNNPRLTKRVRANNPADIALSAIVTYELFYGAFKSQRQAYNLNLLDSLNFETLALDKEDAREAGKIRAELAKKGTPIGPYDILIAGQTKARNMILITRNTSEFKRVTGLRIENWET